MAFSNNIENIYNSHVDDLYAYAVACGFNRNAIMDAIHDLFYRLCNNPSQLNTVDNIRNYLFAALKNTLLNTVRDKKEIISIDDFLTHETFYLNIKVTIEDKLVGAEEQEKISQTITTMLNSLTPRQRQIVYLRYVEEQSYEEITSQMSIDINSCHKLMHKAITALREQFETYAMPFF